MPCPLDFFDRIAIINLPSRQDRLHALATELRRVGFSINHPKIIIPNAPEPEDADGFPSRGVRGNFLSHLHIIEAAYRDGLNNVLVLEDDAIFRAKFRTYPLAEILTVQAWDMFFLGHALKLRPHAVYFVRLTTAFNWAHCYAVNRSVMPRLISYLKDTMERPVGHPLGGRMYIDGAFSLFRQQNTDTISLLSAPRQSSQKGSPSNLAGRKWYDKSRLARPIITVARAVRDELWRRDIIA